MTLPELTVAEFLQLDLVPLASAVLACVTCGLLGTLLLLTLSLIHISEPTRH